MSNINKAIAKDFLLRLPKVGSISKYSPTASQLAAKCSHCYPDDNGFLRIISQTTIIEAAKEQHLLIRMLESGDAQIGVSAEKLHSWLAPAIYSKNLICVHGPVRVTLTEDRNGIREIPICGKCQSGFEAPTSAEIESAADYLFGRHSNQPGAGALYMAALGMGYKTTVSLNGTFTLKKKSPVNTSLERLGFVKCGGKS